MLVLNMLVYFDNRIKSKRPGWVAPSVKYKVDAHIRVIDNVCSILPISRIVIEVAQFDTQKINNPNISGKEYQEGDQLRFWNVREYILARDGHKCQYCKGKSKDSILNVHHINCIAQLNVNPKDSSESFFDVYDRDEMKLIYGIEIGILKEMFGI